MDFSSITKSSSDSQQSEEIGSGIDPLRPADEQKKLLQEDDDDEEEEEEEEESCEGDEDDDDISFDENDPTTLHLRIKSVRDTTITVRSTDTIHFVKQAVLESLQADRSRYIRLILKGRLLAPDSRPLGEFNVQSGDVLHAVLAAVGQRGGAQALLASTAAAETGLHQRPNYQFGASSVNQRITSALLRGAGVTPSGLAVRWSHSPYDDVDDSEASSLEEGRERIGFDRLRSPGNSNNNNSTVPQLSRAEVTAIRAYFNRQIDRWVRHHPEAAQQAMAGETDLMRRRLLLEDAWMATQGPTSEFRFNLAGNLAPTNMIRNANSINLPWRGASSGPGQQQMLMMNMNSVGTDRDFLWGFLLGFFVGFCMLLWVWMPTVPHKQKLGILTGISFQLALTMLQGGNHDNGSSDDAIMGE